MPDIEIQRPHTLGMDGGRAAVERVAAHLQTDLNVDYQWEEDTLRFEGHGADGHIRVQEHVVNVVINLNFLLRPMRGWLESEAERYLDQHLTDTQA